MLAGSLFDLVWLPETWSGKLVRKQAGAGLVPGERVPCSACGGELVRDRLGEVVRRRKGSGWVVDRFRRREPCGGCGGGFVEDRPVPGRGYVSVDPMDRLARPIGAEETPDAPVRVVTALCDACGGSGVENPAASQVARCGRCGGSGRREWSPFELRVDDGSGGDPEAALLAAVAYRDEQGDYAKLEEALALLRRLDVVDGPRLHRLWTRRYVYGDAAALGARDSQLLELAWRFVEAKMPERPRVPAGVRQAERTRRKHAEKVAGRWADPAALGQRNREIRRRFEQGEATVEELIRSFNVSRSVVYEVIYGARDSA